MQHFPGRLTTVADRRVIHPADAGVTPRHSSGLADLAAVGGPLARVAQPVEHDVANVEVAGSRPAARFHLDELTERGGVRLLPASGISSPCHVRTPRSVSSSIAAAACCEATQTNKETPHPLATHSLCGGVAARRPNRTVRHPVCSAAGPSRRHLAACVRRPVADGGVYRALRVDGRGASVQRRQFGAVADQYGCSSVGRQKEGRQ